MENKIEIFKNEELGEVRSLLINGEPYFVAKDVSEILGYSETNALTKRLDDDEFISDKLEGMNMNSILLNESGLYNAIFGSQLKSAKRFRKWVFGEVLPSIRKHGIYITEELLKDKEKLQCEIDKIQNEYYELEHKINDAEIDNNILKAENEDLGKIKKEYSRQQHTLDKLRIKTREEVSYLPRLTLELIRIYIKENPSVVINERDERLILKARPLYKELRKLIMCNNNSNRNIYEILYTMNIYDNETTVAIPVEYLDDNYKPMFEMYMLN